ncbi:radical SAM family heme chaperone HemW [Nitrosophilus labii]|uniref:radical SAM family heme chaperone HemW n=1 Tax=Nitrosophilus labii TaxID=2706014 RepID=UPI00165743C9|nr:radical SAM family heme chaperone HemW [Nitrosophilus labii]
MLLYVHIPFCDSKCFYCSFNSYVEKHHLKVAYINSLLKQLDFELKRFEVKKKSIESVFIGGGTPSTLDALYYENFFKKIEPYLKENVEITVEANPNSAKQEWLTNMRNFGVNRISFGVQSFDNKKLKFLGRSHNSKQAINAVENAYRCGFENISIDIIYETALDTEKLLKKDIDTAFRLPINHISAYALTLEENTPFFGKKEVKKDDEYIGYFIADMIKEKFEQYEISNFGNYKSKHNLGYWQHRDYIGVGCSAVGFLKNRRFYVCNDIEEYIKEPLKISIENLSNEDLISEKIFLGFRSIVGVDIKILNENMLKRAEILKNENKIYEKQNRLYNKNFFLADEIALYLIG